MSEKRRESVKDLNADPSTKAAKAEDKGAAGQPPDSGPGHEWRSLSRRQRLVVIVVLALMAAGILAAGLKYLTDSGLIKLF